MNYYNEWDKGAAAWLRELIKAGLIPNGYVDERSITEVTPADLEGFTQCHFFSGIGGWTLALQLAGVPESTRLWTGSPPCQPFSVAGQSLGFDDERHLAPVLLRLVRECKPQYFFGEQVAAAIGKHWLDFVFLNMEEKGYACGSAVLPACSVGAPHKRDRLFFGAYSLANTDNEHQQSTRDATRFADSDGTGKALSRVAKPLRTEWNGKRLQGLGESDCTQGSGATTEFTGCSGVDRMANPYGERLQRKRPDGDTQRREGSDVRQAGLCNGARASAANPHHGFWSGVDWLSCRDGKYRPVESGTFPLANGIPARVGRLRGYGNAIVPQAAAEFIKAFIGAAAE